LCGQEGGEVVATSSLANWGWVRRPDARAENGCVVHSIHGEYYYPWDRRAELLTAIQKVSDEEEAISFTRQWGELGLVTDASGMDALFAQFAGALEYASSIREPGRTKADPYAVFDNVTAWFDQRPAVVLMDPDRGEPVQLILEFAETIRHLSEAKRIRNSFAEDPSAAEYDAGKWVESLSPKCYGELVGLDLTSWREEHEKFFTEERSFYEYLLDIVIMQARARFFHREQRGVWVELDRRDGRALFEFDTFFRFVAYCLLSDNAPSPKRCKDPQCGQLFFPTRSSRKFCPPLPGHKHSRCEERYGKRHRRAKRADDGMAGPRTAKGASA
jgi:hypothetical protein